MHRILIPRSAAALAILLTVAAASSAAAQAAQPTSATAAGRGVPVAPDVIVRDEAGGATVRAIPLKEPLRVDGRLDETVYQTELAVEGFIQLEPIAGAPATERTEAWVMFDRDAVYVSARCWDSAPPSEWTANEMRRDTGQLLQNDQFGVMFDTFYDRRNGFVFYANPLGGFSDRIVTDEGMAEPEWNPVWEIRTGRFEGGWTIEMAIPFKTLRYRTGNPQVWGVQFRRAVRRKNEWSHITKMPPALRGSSGITRISMAATLVGIEAPPASMQLVTKPYAISRLLTDRVAVQPLSNEVEGDVGLDVKYGVTPNLTADFTVNTDFAQVEVDEQQVNLTRFNLFFPEKRDFFLESRANFDFGSGAGGDRLSDPTVPALFYSRRIGLNAGRVIPIDAGGRVTGKVGKVRMGLLNIQTGDDALSQTPSTNFTALRVKRDVFRRSWVGAMFTNRSHSTIADGANQAFGVDSAFAFFNDLTMGGYYAETRTPGRNTDAASYQTRFNYAGDRYGLQFDYLHVGANFNPEVGFVRRSDFNRGSGVLRFSPRPRRNNWVRKFTYEGIFDYIETGAGLLETREQAGRFNIEFDSSDQLTVLATKRREVLLRPFAVARNVVIPVGGYGFGDVELTYRLGQQRRVSGSLVFQRGSFYDGTITAYGFTTGRVSVIPRFSLEPSVSINLIDLPTGSFSTQVLRTRGDFGFSPRTFASALLQYNSSDRAFSSNLRFRWEYRPGSEFFAVYTDERDTLGRGFPLLRNRAFVLKITRLFQL
jgi:hypothetical protein